MNVFLVVNNNKDVNFTLTEEIIAYLYNKNVNIYSDDKVLINKFSLLELTEDKLMNINFSIIIGGDGTVLKYASKYGECKFPFVGINLGRVGALTILEPDNYKRYLDEMLNNNYHVVKRLGISCLIKFKDNKEDVNFVGYNDIILHRSSSLKLLPIEISLNGGNKDIFYADGLVVATPNGSSAYNASAGGPLLSHSSQCYVITPICPQSKSFIPLVVADNDVLELSLSNKSDIGDNEITISSDGCHKYFISTLDKITIKKSNSVLKMVWFDKEDSMYMPVYKAVVSIERKGEK